MCGAGVGVVWQFAISETASDSLRGPDSVTSLEGR